MIIPGKSMAKDFSIHELTDEMNRALVVSPKKYPENVITMTPGCC